MILFGVWSKHQPESEGYSSDLLLVYTRYACGQIMG